MILRPMHSRDDVFRRPHFSGDHFRHTSRVCKSVTLEEGVVRVPILSAVHLLCHLSVRLLSY